LRVTQLIGASRGEKHVPLTSFVFLSHSIDLQVYLNNKIGNKKFMLKYITLNTKRHYGLNVKMLNYYIYLYK